MKLDTDELFGKEQEYQMYKKSYLKLEKRECVTFSLYRPDVYA